MMQNWIANVPKSYWILALAIVPVAVYLQKNRLPTPICRVVARLGFYPMLPLTVASQYLRGRWYDELEPGVLMGAVPLVTLFDHVGTLYKKHNVRAVVNLMDEYEGPVETYQLLGIDQLRLPTVDHSDMTEADLLAAVRFIARHKQLGHSVYIHCKAGHGRGATTAFAWLLYSGFGDKARIQAHMGRVRRVRSTIFDRVRVDDGSGNVSVGLFEYITADFFLLFYFLLLPFSLLVLFALSTSVSRAPGTSRSSRPEANMISLYCSLAYDL